MKPATGGAGLIITYWLALSLQKAVETIWVTLYVPGSVYVCSGDSCVEVFPSPNLYIYSHGPGLTRLVIFTVASGYVWISGETV